MRSDGAMWHCRRAATNAGVIYYLDYALGTGDVGNWSVTVRVPEGECSPDGMAHFPAFDAFVILRASAPAIPRWTTIPSTSLNFCNTVRGNSAVISPGTTRRNELMYLCTPKNTSVVSAFPASIARAQRLIRATRP